MEEQVVQVHGEISYQHELAINTATRHEAAALLIARWLRLNSEEMSHGERLQYISALGRESDARDRAIERLGLNKDETPWAGVFDGTISQKGEKT
jgi:hypothetical protein